MRKFALITIILLLLCSAAGTEVTLIRKIPDTGEHQVDAQWTKPRPQPEQAAGQTEFSMRIILGGQGGVSATGEQENDLYTDSTLSLAQPLGSAATLNIGGRALRKRYLDGREQSYSTGVDLRAERWSLDLSGSYEDSERTLSEASGLSTTDVDKEDMDLQIASNLSLGLIPTLPMSLSYEHSWIQASEDAAEIEDQQSDSLVFLAEGTLGTVGLKLGGSVANTVDGITDIETFSSSGNLMVNIPLLSFLHLRPEIAPIYTRTEYVNGDYTLSTTLDTNLGFYFPLSEALELRLVAGIANTWSSDRESGVVTENPSQATWQGETGLDWQRDSGFFSSLEYSLASTFQSGAGPNLSHQSALSAGWRNPQERGVLQNLEAGTDLSVQIDESGEVDNGEGRWNVGVNLQPLKTMTLNGGYNGSVNRGETPVAWTHQLETELSHAPDPLLNYQLAASVTDTSSEGAHTLTTDGLGQVTLLPQWNLKVYTISGGENLVLSQELPGGSNQDILAKTFSSVAIPLFSFLQLRYTFTWEWVNRTSESGPPGNAFQHLSGLTLSGEDLPFSLTTDYQLTHGFRGLRHDLNAGLDVPFRKGFGLKGEASFSHYSEEGNTVNPFLVGLHGVYEY